MFTSSRAEILALLKGKRSAHIHSFSGLINITQAGLDALGYRFCEIHIESGKMARAAATTYELFGFESAVLPTDLCVEAEALGANVDFRGDERESMWPIVAHPLTASPADLSIGRDLRIAERGRIPRVLDALGKLKARVGNEIVVGAMVPGPFTLASYVFDLGNLLADVARDPAAVGRALDGLTGPLIEVALAYRAAGADFVTIHEMGGSPGVLGPRAFAELVLPRLQRMTNAIPTPRVLSVCGNTNNAMELLAAAGADALSVDQLNDLKHSRRELGNSVMLFGNIDPVGVLAQGSEAAVRRTVSESIADGADAIWPGCDLWPPTPGENLRAMMAETQKGLAA